MHSNLSYDLIHEKFKQFDKTTLGWRIKDADIAEESTEMTKQNMMLQAGTAILAQANQQPGQALALLNKG